MDLLLGTPNPVGSNFLYSLDASSDIQFDELGKLKTVSGKDKLTQVIAKSLLTQQGSNIFEEKYGSILNSFAGFSISPDPLYALIKQTIIDSMSMLATIQQDITDSSEKMASIEELSVSFNTEGKNEIQIELKVMTEEDQELTTSILVPL